MVLPQMGQRLGWEIMAADGVTDLSTLPSKGKATVQINEPSAAIPEQVYTGSRQDCRFDPASAAASVASG
jgi:hypothetical protein